MENHTRIFSFSASGGERKIIENLEKRLCKGINKIPFSQVIRKTLVNLQLEHEDNK